MNGTETGTGMKTGTTGRGIDLAETMGRITAGLGATGNAVTGIEATVTTAIMNILDSVYLFHDTQQTMYYFLQFSLPTQP